MMREYSLHAKLSLESALLPQQIKRLAQAGPCRQMASGEFVFHQGQGAGHVYLLRRGLAKSFMVNSNGQEALLRIHLPGSLMGLTALTSCRLRDASAVTIEPSQITEVKREDLLAIFKADAELSVRVLQLVLDRMSDFHMRVGELAANRVEQRLARALLSLSRPDTEPGARLRSHIIPLTHEELAQLINSRRQTVTAVLSRFAQAGLICREDRHVVITDPMGLACLLPV
jgi:CRP-like cAMP-binding protein